MTEHRNLVERLRTYAADVLRAYPNDICSKAADEIERLQEAKRKALAIADERSKENVALRAENERLRADLAFVKAQIANNCDVDMVPCEPVKYCLCAQHAKEWRDDEQDARKP